MDSPQYITVKSPRYISYLIGQAFGVANDNAIKMTMTAFVLSTIIREQQVFYTSIIAALLPIAFLMFSPFAGYLSDRYAKNKVLFYSKSPEIFAMLFSCVALYFNSLPLLLISFFFMSMQSAFFGPAKYGILPEAFHKEDLSMANGLLNMTTNIAILLGAVLGGLLFDVFEGQLVWAGVVYLVIALLGTFFVYFAPPVQPKRPDAPVEWNVITYLWKNFPKVSKTPVVMNTIWGITFFYGLGALFMTVIPVYAKNVMGLDSAAATLTLALLTVGVAIGSVLVAHLSRDNIEVGWVPYGCFALGLFAIDLACYGDTGTRTFMNFTIRSVVDLFLLGIASGFFIVPLFAQLQNKSPENEKGHYIAFSNIISFGGILAASLLAIFFSSVLGMDSSSIMITVGIVTILYSLVMAATIPDQILRIIILEIVNTLYKVRAINKKNQPKRGMVVSNHLSYFDPFVLGSTFEKMLSYLMFRSFYEMPGTTWVWKKLNCIPVSGGDSAEKKQESLDIAHKFIADDGVVCIFPEGKLWRTGNLLPFKSGFQKIVAGVDCQVVPVYLDGLWGSQFSYERGTFFFKKPIKFSDSINVIFGEPLPSTVDAFTARSKVMELSAEAYRHRLKDPQPLHIQFISVAKNNWKKTFIIGEKAHLTFGEVLTQALSWSCPTEIPAGSRVAVSLPNDTAFIVHLALLYKGLIPVHISDVVQCEKLEITHVITNEETQNSKSNLKTFSWQSPTQNVSLAFKSSKKIEKNHVVGNPHCDDEFTVYAESNTSISHRNVYSSIKSFQQTFELKTDTILATESIHKPFSFVANFWIPALQAQQIMCISPDSSKFKESSNQISIIFTDDPQKHLSYINQISSQIRYFGVVADTINEKILGQYKEDFNIDIMQMYALDTCNIVTLNRPDFIDEANFNTQIGKRPGSIGLPLPEVAIRIVDIETMEDVGMDAEGTIMVKGPNVAQKDRNPQLQFHNDWLVTKLKGHFDEKCFVHLASHDA
ncbi:MFS transporter [Candidatus Uabimicrobium amorphum]|uniref:Acyl-[ACP]--phospholipid O-acyltransferase n=1 Tax=Uabimicrobium amorphum TaxID=2596890 RepID=A0A5S9IU51_UABAM|nr:MFS transporter [Candidatus Uabimicrobium amorphum]BBM88193.1 acyl-[ACP]--phospholipid O-acyltransferase [Candidatus Uabimicrobium amorphum]